MERVTRSFLNSVLTEVEDMSDKDSKEYLLEILYSLLNMKDSKVPWSPLYHAGVQLRPGQMIILWKLLQNLGEITRHEVLDQVHDAIYGPDGDREQNRYRDIKMIKTAIKHLPLKIKCVKSVGYTIYKTQEVKLPWEKE